MTLDYTPWIKHYENLSIWRATDSVLAEAAADTAVTTIDDGDSEFACALTELFVLRAQIFNHPNIAVIARSSMNIEAQTRDATWIDPDAWPDDVAGAAIQVWKSTVRR